MHGDRRSLAGAVRYVAYNMGVPARAHARARSARADLAEVLVRPGLADARLVAVVLVRDEARRLPYFFDYYAARGVDHFIVIDNGSSDSSRDIAQARPDTSLYAATGGFKAARFGMDWVNVVLSRHCVGKWILHVDVDEFLVVDGVADIASACSELDRRGDVSMQTLMLDMYAASEARNVPLLPTQDPLEACDRFDASGYVEKLDELQNVRWVWGGVRGRVFFPDDPRRGPALNKIPLVRWRRHYAFVQCAHRLWPRQVCGGDSERLGVLLHMKFTRTSVDKMTDPTVTVEHSEEYDAYKGLTRSSFVGPPTRTYTSPSDLVEAGLMGSFARRPSAQQSGAA